MVDGLDRLRAKLTRKIPQRVRHHLDQTMEQYAGKVVDDMEAFAPEEEGDLKASIFHSAPYDTKRGRAVMISAGDESTVVTNKTGGKFQNARIQEFGTKDTPASPYFYVSWRLNKRRTKAAMRRAVKKGLSEGSR